MPGGDPGSECATVRFPDSSPWVSWGVEVRGEKVEYGVLHSIHAYNPRL